MINENSQGIRGHFQLYICAKKRAKSCSPFHVREFYFFQVHFPSRHQHPASPTVSPPPARFHLCFPSQQRWFVPGYLQSCLSCRPARGVGNGFSFLFQSNPYLAATQSLCSDGGGDRQVSSQNWDCVIIARVVCLSLRLLYYFSCLHTWSEAELCKVSSARVSH